MIEWKLSRLIAAPIFGVAMAGLAPSAFAQNPDLPPPGIFDAPLTPPAPLEQTEPTEKSEDKTRDAPKAEKTEAAAKAKAEKPKPEEVRADLFRRLASKDARVSAKARKRIEAQWRKSGSASLDLLRIRAERAIAKKDWKTADRHLTQLINLKPDLPLGWVLRARVRMSDKRYGPALSDAAEALALEPLHYEALLYSAVLLRGIDEKEKALKAIRRTLEINPHQPQAKELEKQLIREVDGVEA